MWSETVLGSALAVCSSWAWKIDVGKSRSGFLVLCYPSVSADQYFSFPFLIILASGSWLWEELWPECFML